MQECRGFTRWALGLLLLLGACGGTSPELVALPAPPPAIAPESNDLRPAESDVAAPAPAAGADGVVVAAPSEPVGILAPAAAPSPGDGELDEMLAGVKSEEPLPAAEPLAAPDRRTAAAVVAARPPGTAVS
jgi:hypothetical protein